MYLIELFNTTVPLKTIQDDGDVEMRGQLPDGTWIAVQFGKEGAERNDYELTFARGERSDFADSRFDKTKLGSEKMVFGVVVNAVNQFVQRFHPDQITFTADKSPSGFDDRKESRTNLYTAMVNRFTIPGWRKVKVPHQGFDDYRLIRIGSPADKYIENENAPQ